ncbi:Hypothetical protein CINCED_3A022767 [Cinara cedri]|uniref:Microtubule-associated protein, MAP65/Ase1/PRC1 n=1 Tax=Cinara cedri TaxID=506608 RepID=A0A5E4NT75_9HEMI|nr:Hypothetical protein CINCED_3A022767 [Cinara cedri]
MSAFLYGSPLTKDDSDLMKTTGINSSMSSDANGIKLILDELYVYSKKEILKVKQNLDDIYGANSDEKKNGMNQLREHFKLHVATFFDEVVLESDKDKNNVIKDIEELLSEKEVLERELKMHINIDEQNDSTPLIDVQIAIDKALKNCRQIKLDRMTELNRLQEEEKQLCKLLDIKPKYADFKEMPTPVQLETINHHITDLHNTQIKRQATFLEQRAKVEILFTTLGEIPILHFDKLVLGNPDLFQLSKSNLDELQKLIKRLENQAENQKSMATELRTKLNTLWNRLLVNVTYRERFVSTKLGYDKSVINELKKEVERCETLKKENVKQFIEKLRAELNDLWDRCHFGEHQRKQCHIYYKNECTEDVMDLLDIEVDNARKFYNENQSIFYLMEEREDLWQKMIVMKEHANDPARLWQNRGGQLLKEEKERKTIQKELPRVEKELKHLLQTYEQREGKPFLFNDNRLLDIIDNQWNEMRNNKKPIQQTKSKILIGVRPQTPQTVTRSKRKIVPASSSNQSSKVRKVDTDHKAREHLESKKHMLFASPTKNILGEQNNTPGKRLMKTPIKGSQIPIPTTPKTPIRTTPKTPNTRTVTKLTRTITNKLPIIF